MAFENALTEQSVGIKDLQAADQSRFLRRVLQGNVIFSALSGVLFLVYPGPVAALLGFTSPTAATILMELGVGLLLWAGYTYWISTRPVMKKWQVFSIIEGDILWVVGSVLLLVTGWLTFSTSGKWAVAIVADVVGLFAILQYFGWRRMQNNSKGSRA